MILETCPLQVSLQAPAPSHHLAGLRNSCPKLSQTRHTCKIPLRTLMRTHVQHSHCSGIYVAHGSPLSLLMTLISSQLALACPQCILTSWKGMIVTTRSQLISLHSPSPMPALLHQWDSLQITMQGVFSLFWVLGLLNASVKVHPL